MRMHDFLELNTKIIALHRVLPEKQIENGLIDTTSMVTSSEKLEYFINSFLNGGGEFVSVDDAIFSSNEKKARIAITVDDGYIDFYDQLYPLLNKYKIPACIYVISGFPDNNCFDSYGTLADFIEKNTNHSFIINGKNYDLSFKTHKEKKEVLLLLDEIIEGLICNHDMQDAFSIIGIPSFNEQKRLTLSWDNISELNKNNLITVGSHSVSHPRLTKSSTAKIIAELKDSKLRLEEMLNTQIDHFAYPYGDHNLLTADIAKNAGYKSAVTIIPGNIDTSSANFYALPRIWLDRNFNVVI